MKIATMVKSALLAMTVIVSSIACAQPDGVITAKIKTKIAADDALSGAEIDVTTREHVVTLTGNLDSEAAKTRALEIARSTDGVTDVKDMLAVRDGARGDAPQPERTLGTHIDDAGITAAVKARLLDDPQVKGAKIDVDTRDGVVFLTGSVRSEAMKERAIEIARATENVRDVRPNLDVDNARG